MTIDYIMIDRIMIVNFVMIDCIMIDCIMIILVDFLNFNNSITLAVHLPILNVDLPIIVLTTYHTDNYFGIETVHFDTCMAGKYKLNYCMHLSVLFYFEKECFSKLRFVADV